jgi:hypothetical protein
MASTSFKGLAWALGILLVWHVALLGVACELREERGERKREGLFCVLSSRGGGRRFSSHRSISSLSRTHAFAGGLFQQVVTLRKAMRAA